MHSKILETLNVFQGNLINKTKLIINSNHVQLATIIPAQSSLKNKTKIINFSIKLKKNKNYFLSQESTLKEEIN
jgi:hypothetical protein